ncbi:hypothetical protein ERW51_02895 [Aliivibrio finisterrensis]|uniref:hypothetical protein n=1 Tax=Aliivibrio finisterrensis TaxID=511998 RepID=UPI001022614C|nr:hypothetical protein [Aliivibrio finisterrensis]RYU70476.1 hypothetical protein ERW54_02900 [Aliivibrio finisterrensis]RYU74338.1 hypothetical protein ERW51_02895 [Aliivibrio finisterrensis]RYU76943.1 hypothetical protein ERW48_02910 [Aliivibrio finisterrensis]
MKNLKLIIIATSLLVLLTGCGSDDGETYHGVASTKTTTSSSGTIIETETNHHGQIKDPIINIPSGLTNEINNLESSSKINNGQVSKVNSRGKTEFDGTVFGSAVTPSKLYLNRNLIQGSSNDDVAQELYFLSTPKSDKSQSTIRVMSIDPNDKLTKIAFNKYTLSFKICEGQYIKSLSVIDATKQIMNDSKKRTCQINIFHNAKNTALFIDVDTHEVIGYSYTGQTRYFEYGETFTTGASW